MSHHDTPEMLEKILDEHPEIEFVQLQINYLDWENKAIQSKNVTKQQKNTDDILIMEPVKGGNIVHLPQKAQCCQLNF